MRQYVKDSTYWPDLINLPKIKDDIKKYIKYKQKYIQLQELIGGGKLTKGTVIVSNPATGWKSCSWNTTRRKIIWHWKLYYISSNSGKIHYWKNDDELINL